MSYINAEHIIQDFRDSLTKSATPDIRTPRLELAEVVAEGLDGTCTIRLTSATEDIEVAGVRKMRGDTPVGAVAVVAWLGSDLIVLGTLDSGQEWVQFTPTWTNVTLGTGETNVGWYRRQGNLVEWKVELTLGTGGDVTGFIEMDGPFTIVALLDQSTAYCVGRNIGASPENHAGVAVGDQFTTKWMRRITTSSVGAWDATTPFDWGPGDQILASGTLFLQQ